MQVRYVFDPDLSQARSRLAHALLPALESALQTAADLHFKAEATGRSATPAGRFTIPCWPARLWAPSC